MIVDGVSYVALLDAEKIVNAVAVSYNYYIVDNYGGVEFERNAEEEDFETIY